MTSRFGARRRAWLVAFAALAIIAASCGDDDDDSADVDTTTTVAAEGGDDTTTTAAEAGGDETTTTAAPDETTTTAAAAVDCTLDAPVRLINGLGDPYQSDDPNAASATDPFDGMQMAIEEINEAGGICGQPIEFETPVITPATFGDQAIADVAAWLAAEPTVIFGFGSSSALDAAAADVAAGGIPLINFSTNPQALTGGTAASEWLWSIRVPNDESASAAAQYAIDELGACNFGLLYFNLSFGLAGSDAQKATIAENGCTVGAEAPHDFNAEDLTTEVLAMDGTDVVLSWGTPNNLLLEIPTFEAQGLDIPLVMPGSAGFSSFYTAFEPDQLDNIIMNLDCNPLDADPEWSAAFEERAGYLPSYYAAQTYDTVYILKAVIEANGAADPATLQAAFNGLDTDGVCGPYANSDNSWAVESTFAEFNDEGLPATLAVIPLG